MLIELSIFSECKSTYAGGAICQRTQGECVVKQCCGLQCYSTTSGYEGQFIRTDLSNDSNKKNRVLDSSVSHSMENSENPSWGYTLDLRYGTIQINTVNLSNNICNYYSAVYAYPSTSSNTACSITYSSINSNEARSSQIIRFDRNDQKYNIRPTNIKDCCIMKNEAKYIFYGASSYGGSITLTNISMRDPYFSDKLIHLIIHINTLLFPQFSCV